MSVNSMFGMKEEEIPTFFERVIVLYEKIKNSETTSKQTILKEHGVAFRNSPTNILFKYLLLRLNIKPECISDLQTLEVVHIHAAVFNKKIHNKAKTVFLKLEYSENSDSVSDSEMDDAVGTPEITLTDVRPEESKEPVKEVTIDIKNSEDIEAVKHMMREQPLEKIYLSGNIKFKDFEQLIILAIKNPTMKTFSVESEAFDCVWLKCLVDKLEPLAKNPELEKHFHLGGRELKYGEWSRAFRNFNGIVGGDNEKITLEKIENTTVPAPVMESRVVATEKPETITGGAIAPEIVVGFYIKNFYVSEFVFGSCRGNALAYKNIFDQTILLTSGDFNSSIRLKDSIFVPYEDIVCLICNKGEHKYCLSPSEDYLIQNKLPRLCATDIMHYIDCCRHKNKWLKDLSLLERIYTHTEIQIQGLLGCLNKELKKEKDRDEDLVKTIICLLPKLLVVQLNNPTNSEVLNGKIQEEREAFMGLKTRQQEQEQEVFRPMSRKHVKAQHHDCCPVVRRRPDPDIETPSSKLRTVFVEPEQASSFCIFSLFEACQMCRKVKWLNDGSGIPNKLFFKFAILDHQVTKDGWYIHNNRKRGTHTFVDQLALEEGHIFLDRACQLTPLRRK